MNWVLPGEQDALSASHFVLPLTLVVPADPGQQVFHSLFTKNGNNNVKQTTQCLGSTPPQSPVHCLTPERAKSQIPPWILLKMVLVPWLWQNSFCSFVRCSKNPGKWIPASGHYIFREGKKELLLPFVFFIHCTIWKKPLGWSVSLILILSNSCVQGNQIMLILLCSFCLQTVPGVSPWCWWDLGHIPRAGIGQMESAKWGRTWRTSEGINHEPAWPAPGLRGSDIPAVYRRANPVRQTPG